MRRLLRNHTARRAGWLLLAGLAQFVFALSAFTSPVDPSWLIGIWIATAFVAWGRDRNWTMVMLTLPLSLRDVGRVLWWAHIGVSGMLLTGAGLLALLFGAILWPSSLNPLQIGIYILGSWAMLGLFMFVSLPKMREGGLQIRSTFYVVFGILLAASAMPESLWPLVSISISALGAGLALRSYWQADRLALRRLSGAGSVEPGSRRRTRAQSAQSRGWGVLVQRYGLTTLTFAAAGTCIIAITIPPDPVAHKHLALSLPLVSMLLPQSARPWVTAARALRPLPMNAPQLAGVLLVMALLPAGAAILLLLDACPITPLACTGLPHSLFPTLLWFACFEPALVLSCGGNKEEEVMIRSALTIGFIMIGGVLFVAAAPPLSFVLAVLITTVFLILGYLWTCYEIAVGKHAYTAPETGAFSGRRAETG